MTKPVLKDKRVELRVSNEFYEAISAHCKEFSITITSGITNLVRKQLYEIKVRGGVSKELSLDPKLHAEIEHWKDPHETANDFVHRTLWKSIGWLQNNAAKRQNQNPYTDTKHDEDSEAPQSSLLKSMGYYKKNK